MKVLLRYLGAAFAEIAGCFAFRVWLRLHRSPLWAVPGVISLIIFALALTRIETAAGRAFAAYGGVYIVSALLWMWLVEKVQPDQWDLMGAAMCLAGAALIIFGPRCL